MNKFVVLLLLCALAPAQPRRDPEAPEVRFVSNILDDVQHTWDRLLPQQEHRAYRHAKLVLYRDRYPSGCGAAKSSTGPFYCPPDEKVYLDLGFFKELRTRFGAPGDFAQAYVIAHEFGHHVQKILGRRGPSVPLELQADCFAGVWANNTERRGLAGSNDIEAAMRAAASVGDDRLQRLGQGYVNPEKFTHGSSAERVRWFRRGVASGRLADCNTFGPR